MKKGKEIEKKVNLVTGVGIVGGAVLADDFAGAELAQVARVVAQRVVDVRQRVDGARRPEKVRRRLDVVVAVHHRHDLLFRNTRASRQLGFPPHFTWLCLIVLAL